MDNLDPARCAVLINECQEGVVGEGSALPDLRKHVEPALQGVGRLVRAAHAAGVQVVHATFEGFPGRATFAPNSPLGRMMTEQVQNWTPGSPPTCIVPEIPLGPDDLVLARHHGLSPTQGTEVLSILRNLGIETVVVAGVSLNVAIPSVVVDAVNEGFRAFVPTDAVAGSPPEYGKMVLRHTIAVVATLTTVEELTAAWVTR